jgi:hypothetical protein
MFGKYNGFVSKARVSACMYFLVLNMNKLSVVEMQVPEIYKENFDVSNEGSSSLG